MLRVSNSLPIDNYSTNVLSDSAGTTFNPKTNGRIRVKIPSHLGMVDFHNSHLQYTAKINPPSVSQEAVSGDRRDVANMGWSHNQGATSCVRDLRVLVDGKEIESISNYNVLDLLDKNFGRDLAMKEINSVLDKSIGLNPFTTSYNASTPVVAYDTAGIKQVCKLNLSGLATLPVGFPVLATGDVELEITLEDSARCLEPHGKHQEVSTTATTGVGGDLTTITIPASSLVGAGWGSATDCAFAVGSTISVSADTGWKITTNGSTQVGTTGFKDMRARITAVVDNAGAIDLTIADVGAGALQNTTALTNCKISLLLGVEAVSGAKRASQYAYEVNDVQYVCRAVNMPPPYLSSLQQRIQTEGGLSLDIHSFSSYLDVVKENVSRQSLSVPCYSNRLKAVFGVPVEATQTDYAYDRRGKIDNLRNYQSQIGSRREPSRPVDLTNTTHADSNAEYPSQEYIQELEKSFLASSMGLRTLRKWRDNFCLNRSLSYGGGSEDLSDKMFRFEIEHNTSINTTKNLYAFAHHTKRLQITPSGLQVYS